MKGVIMAGGEGSRLRPMTCSKPKPLIDVMDKPVMAYIIELLRGSGVTDIAVTLQYMPQHIIDYFGDGSAFGVRLEYFVETSPLGTAGSVKNAQEFLDDGDFIIISGDCLTDIDLKKAMDFHKAKSSLATLVLSRVDTPLEYGVVVTDDEGRIIRFLEKPNWSEVFSDTVNTGIYILNASVLNLFQKGIKFDFSRDLFPILLDSNRPLYGYVAEGYWCDIGDLDAYSKCHRDILDGKVKIKLTASQSDEGIYLGEGARLDKAVSIMPPVYIGSEAVVHSGAKIMPYSVLGEKSKIYEGASTKQVVLHKGVTLGKMAQVRGAILCDAVSIGNFSSVYEKSVVGERCVIEDMCEIKTDVKIWPHKFVSKGTELSVNLVWGSKFSRNLFGEKGVSGAVNVDVTPEFATRLGATFGAMLKSGKIGVGYGGGGALLMLKNAFISGLLSSGCEVFDFNVQSLPITRRGIPFYGLKGGVHLALSDGRLIMNFLDHDGVDITRSDERKLEGLFIREDFVRAEAGDIKNVTTLSGYNLYYLREILANKKPGVSVPAISIISNCDVVSSLATTVLTQLGVTVHTSADNANIITAYIDDFGEQMILQDELGRRFDSDHYLALICEMLLKRGRADTVVAPISCTNVIDTIAQEYGAKVVRCKVSVQNIMRELLKLKLYDQFRMMFDSVYALGEIAELLTNEQARLCDLFDAIPNFYLRTREVACDFDKKGLVMRTLSENTKMAQVGEGVKITNDNGWVLIIPDSERPSCKVISEGVNAEFAAELCDIYVQKVKNISSKS